MSGRAMVMYVLGAAFASLSLNAVFSHASAGWRVWQAVLAAVDLVATWRFIRESSVEADMRGAAKLLALFLR